MTVKETDLTKELIDLEKAAARASKTAVDYATRYNERVQGYMVEFNELMAKIRVEEDEGELAELEEQAAELAEELEIQFVYTRTNGDVRTYYPQAHWEPSSGCEWVESAYEGVHYGWNL